MANFDKYINSKNIHYISNSGSDERGKYNSGTAGDQTGKEWQLRSWYSRPWTHVFRYENSSKVGEKLCELGCAAALNDNIGYDQYQRATYWTQLQKAGYNPAKITTKCESDCSAGVAANVKAVGYLLNIKSLQNVSSSMTSRNTISQLKNAGFTVLTNSKYLSSGKYLLPGDILLYENHHVAMNITKGEKAIPLAETSDLDLNLNTIGIATAKYNMYVRPSVTSTSYYGTVNKGQLVEVLEVLNNGWMKVLWPNSPTGYGYTSNRENKYYEFTAKNAAEQRYKTTGNLNIRAGAGINNTSLVVLPINQVVKYKGQYKNVNDVKWLYINTIYKNKEYNGWASSRYLKKV